MARAAGSDVMPLSTVCTVQTRHCAVDCVSGSGQQGTWQSFHESVAQLALNGDDGYVNKGPLYKEAGRFVLVVLLALTSEKTESRWQREMRQLQLSR